MMGSASARTIAAGAVPTRIASARTLELELEPRPPGITSTVPVTTAPTCGWWASMIAPVAGSSPPQKLSGSERTSAGPRASPGTSVRPLGIRPHRLVAHDPPGLGREHAVFQAPDHDVHAD